MVKPIAERFWSKVNKTVDCWLWTASTTRGGYGQFGIRSLRVSNFKATHVAVWLTTGEWPASGLDRVRKLISIGLSNPDAAARIGCTPKAVSRIRTGARWSHLKQEAA